MNQEPSVASREAFDKAYSDLNKAQRQAVDAIEGPVMVVAGPGTGKTQILTLRIANILIKTDTAPESVLALTFTESGARAMRQRLRHFIGAAAYRVRIQTFHSFAGDLISNYPDAYPSIVGGKPVGDIERVEILESVLADSEIKLLRPIGNPSFYIKPILSIINTLKQEYIGPDELSSIIEGQETELAKLPKFHEKGAHKGKVRGEYQKKEQAIAKNRELLKIYRTYQAALRERNLYDFEDMISESIKALSENLDMLRDLQESYQYLLADEHQDVNGGQNKLLELLADYHDSPNLFVVGDEKQAIYRFQGASLENFLYFESRYKTTNVISLTDNYRSTQTILDLAHTLIKTDSGPLSKLRIPLVSKVSGDSEVSKRSFSHRAVENEWLADSIQAEIEAGVPESEIVVIVRNNREVENLSQFLRKRGLVVNASAEGDILNHPIVNSILDLVRVAAHNGDEESLFRLLHAPYWGISQNDLFKILTARSYRSSLFELLSDKEKLASLELENTDSVLKIVKLFDEVKELSTTKTLPFLLEYLLRESGLLQNLLVNDAVSSVRVVRRLYDEVEVLWQQGVLSMIDLVRQLDKYQELNLALNAPFLATTREAVQVMTAHKSKGLEFECVYLPHVVDQAWGTKNQRQYFDIPLSSFSSEIDDQDDERRLFYVAITRAKKKIFFSSSDTDETGRDYLETRFLSELGDNTISLEKTDKEEESFSPARELSLPQQTSQIDSALLVSHLEERGLSATSLNNYLNSPWDYLYRNVLRIPEVKTLPLLYGTAVHNVLQKFTKSHTDKGEFLSDSVVSSLLKKELERLPVSESEFAALHEKGLASLVVYLEQLKRVLPERTKEEMSLRVSLPTGLDSFPEVILTGKLDRVDFAEDGRWLRVVDYKTGRPKSRNDIEGNTKNSSGNYKRQLVFYALMASLWEGELSSSTEYVLSFVESDKKGQIKEEAFSIELDEIEALKSEIIAIVDEIVSGEMLKKACDPSRSDYCELVELLT